MDLAHGQTQNARVAGRCGFRISGWACVPQARRMMD